MAKAKTIMVVDDEVEIRHLLEILLIRNGYKVVTAVNGDDCLKKLKKNKVDLILLDIMMPGTPVREVIKKIKGMKIAYLTVVRTSEAEREKLLEGKGVVAFIQKPFDIDVLVATIKKILGD